MSGRPIPGSHWVKLTWPGYAIRSVTRGVVDYETACCDDYTFAISESKNGGDERLLYDSQIASHKANTKVTLDKPNKSIIHDIQMKSDLGLSTSQSFDTITFNMRRPGTQWGTSVWQIQVWGTLARV